MDKQVEHEMDKLALNLRNMVSSLRGPNLQKNAINLFGHLILLAKENPSEWRGLLNEEIVYRDEFVDYLNSTWVIGYGKEVSVGRNFDPGFEFDSKNDEVGPKKVFVAKQLEKIVEKRRGEDAGSSNNPIEVSHGNKETEHDNAKRIRKDRTTSLKVVNDKEVKMKPTARTSNKYEKYQVLAETTGSILRFSCNYCSFEDKDVEVVKEHKARCETRTLVKDAIRLHKSVDDLSQEPNSNSK